MKKTFKKAFTLVEMLIVVIIIWILISALMPRLTWAQSWARDVARQKAIADLDTAFFQYFSDKWTFPNWTCATGTALQTALKPYMTSIPKDPQGGRIVYWTKVSWCGGWEYAFSAIKSAWADSGSVVMLANLEKFGKSPNRVLTWWEGGDYKQDIAFNWDKDVDDLRNGICDRWVVQSSGSKSCFGDSKEWSAKEQNAALYVMFR